MQFYYTILVFFLSIPVLVFAQEANPPREGGDAGVVREGGNAAPTFSGSARLENPLDNITTIPGFFRAIIEILLVFAIPFIVFFIIWAGFLYVTARGNPEKIKQAHNALLYALIGGLLILGANLLLDVITNTVEQVQ